MNHLTSDVAAPASGHPGTEEPKKPFWVKCSACGHIWAAAYLPMVAELFGKLTKVRCPMCAHGPKGILVAKQDNGILMEQGK